MDFVKAGDITGDIIKKYPCLKRFIVGGSWSSNKINEFMGAGFVEFGGTMKASIINIILDKLLGEEG